MTSIKHWFNPEIIKTFTSKYNSKIQLIKFMGKYRLDMGDLTQSGPIIEDIWQSSLKKFIPEGFSPKNILILGFCTGSAARIIKRKYSDCQIIGVEIDPVVIDIAKTYFKTDQINNLKIINSNAIDYLNKLNPTDKFDVILIDCYLGHQIPHQFEDLNTLKKIKSITKILLLNRLYWDNHKIKTIQFIEKIQKRFTIITHRTTWNMIISLS